jgi:hypothetical protein
VHRLLESPRLAPGGLAAPRRVYVREQDREEEQAVEEKIIEARRTQKIYGTGEHQTLRIGR